MLTRLLFHFDGETYSDTGDKTVRVRGASSGLEKRQCTVQVTLFANGVPQVKPMVIFHEKGKRIYLRKNVSLQSKYIRYILIMI